MLLCKAHIAQTSSLFFKDNSETLTTFCPHFLHFHSYNSTKTDRPRLALLVGPHAALCKPDQGLAAPPQLPDELSSTDRPVNL